MLPCVKGNTRKLHYYYGNDLLKQNESSLGIMKWDLKHEKNYLILLLFWTFIILNINWELFVSQRKEARLEEQWKEQRVPGITIEKGSS